MQFASSRLEKVTTSPSAVITVSETTAELYGSVDLRDNIWHHVAWVRDKAADACYTYIDGGLEATHPSAGADVTFATTHSIGGDNRSDPPNFHGLMDDLQIYSRALSHAEIAWLAGRTKPFDKPF